MEWLNLHASVLDSVEFVGSEPVEQATWLKLLRFSIGQENGGRIAGCGAWKDRKWQQLTRCTKREVAEACDLWTWDGEDLVVSFYPVEKETEVKANRENGKKGGRPRKETQTGTQKKPPGYESDNPPETKRAEIAETEGKGNRKGREIVEAAASTAAAETETDPEELAKMAEALVDASPKPDKTLPGLNAAMNCLKRHPGKFGEILEGCRRATAAIAEWTEDERVAYRPGPERFFREDQWRKSDWTSRRASKVAIHKPAAVDIGGRKPKLLDLGIE